MHLAEYNNRRPAHTRTMLSFIRDNLNYRSDQDTKPVGGSCGIGKLPHDKLKWSFHQDFHVYDRNRRRQPN
ncbi:hypothetical protein CA54_23630 [Symmachiella macrocystis]|uniref:Uncharacterized protein n=1 Tax=Symmachiella macrocystis TaxID=2527985 RepID=A0A5C6BN85_9PLAN|nr:hypothetical protein CA54_23630 [Symmachiella macrocystis]